MKSKNQAIILFCIALFNLVYFTLALSWTGHLLTYLWFHLIGGLTLIYNSRAKTSETYVVSLATAGIGTGCSIVSFVLATSVVVFTPFTGNLAIFAEGLVLLTFILMAYINAKTL